jgi:RHS repeat-associated protein
LTGGDGSVRSRTVYDAWGMQRARTGATWNRFSFTGYEEDRETGLLYAKARFYDPDTARFLSRDPLLGNAQNAPSLHRYLYAFGNPTRYVDPTGMAPNSVYENEDDIPSGATYIQLTDHFVTGQNVDGQFVPDNQQWSIPVQMALDLEHPVKVKESPGLREKAGRLLTWLTEEIDSQIAPSASDPSTATNDVAEQVRREIAADRTANAQEIARSGNRELVSLVTDPDTLHEGGEILTGDRKLSEAPRILIWLGLETAASRFLPRFLRKSAKKQERLDATAKPFSDEKSALVDMANQDKRTGMTADDMQAYKDLNRELPDPFPRNRVRGPEAHPNRLHGKEPHGHVGPVKHIPVKED